MLCIDHRSDKGRDINSNNDMVAKEKVNIDDNQSVVE